MELLITKPQKSLYQLFLVSKIGGTVIKDSRVVAFNETEAFEIAKIGSYLKELGLARTDVDLYIRAVGYLYAEDVFTEAKTPELTTDEKANVGKTIESRLLTVEADIAKLNGVAV